MSAIVHLLSGGLDSTTLLYDLKQQGKQVHCVMFDYKQRHVQELLFAKIHCCRLNVQYTTIFLPGLGGLTVTDWIVPFRNPIMISLSVNVAVSLGADTVTIGCNKDDAEQFPDCRWVVIDAMNHAVKTSELKVEIKAPYLELTKSQIAAKAKTLGIMPCEIWTCYFGGSAPCGKCPACLKLNEALYDGYAIK